MKLPEPLAPGKKSTASNADVKRVRGVIDGVATYWESLRKPEGVDLGYATNFYFAKDLQISRAGKLSADVTIDVDGVFRTSEELGEALRVVRVRDGLLALVCLEVRSRLVVNKPNYFINNNGLAAKVFGKGKRRKENQNWDATLAITVPDDGPARVIGNSLIPVKK